MSEPPHTLALHPQCLLGWAAKGLGAVLQFWLSNETVCILANGSDLRPCVQLKGKCFLL